MMDLNLDELDSAPVRKSGRGGLIMLVIGIALGVAGTLLLPRYVLPMLPESLRRGGEQVDGVVLAMGRDGDKLLITVDTQKGAVLATFTRRVTEVELLVRTGDTLTLSMDHYDPFVNDPTIAAVRKDRSAAESEDAVGGESVTHTRSAAESEDAVAQPDMEEADPEVDDAVLPDTAEADPAQADTMRPGAENVVEEAGAATD
jgi:hypothetical protein